MSTQALIQEGIGLFKNEKYDEAIAKLNEALESIADKSENTQAQNNAQHWLGRCYLEQALRADDKKSAIDLLNKAIQHHQKELALAKKLKNVDKQRIAQSWLGRCYLEQALRTDDKKVAIDLLDNAIQHRQQELALAKKLEKDDKQGIAQHWLGRCYLEQSLRTDDKKVAISLLNKATQHHQKELALTEKLEKDDEQGIAQHWLGHCYLEQALRTDDKKVATDLLDKAIQHRQKELALAEKLEQDDEQRIAQGWLGRCYLEQALRTDDKKVATDLLNKAIQHRQKELALAEKLEQDNEQRIAQHWLGRCYFLQSRIKDNKKDIKTLLNNSIQHHTQEENLARKLKQYDKQIIAQGWLGNCYLAYREIGEETTSFKRARAIQIWKNSLTLAKQLQDTKKINNIQRRIHEAYFHNAKKSENFQEYLDYKKEYIKDQLQDKLVSDIKEEVISLLAILHIHPVEISDIPLAHYTSANVSNILFQLNQTDSSNKENPYSHYMRLTSATYMNDPTEGKSLFELLGHPEVNLDNISTFSNKNAFFTCFSSRINDLNQFRLYGKEESIEASGCCFIFHKKAPWKNSANISASFEKGSPDSLMDDNETQIRQTDNKENTELPIYQIAYIAYMDNYTRNNSLKKITKEFSILLHPIGKGDTHLLKERKERLTKTLKDLHKKLKEQENISTVQKQDLEYIRYLFKDFAFRDEEEFRLLKMAEIGIDTQYCQITKSIYIPYVDISDKVDEVILGTNYEKTSTSRKAEVFRHHIKEKYPNIDVKVTQSSLPINANIPAKSKA